MLVFLFGLPGAFSDWCEALAVDIAGFAFGPTALFHADTLEQIAGTMLESGAPHAVVSSRHPGRRLRAAVVQHRRPVILALDDPGPALADLVLRGGVELAAAVQQIAGSCGALFDGDRIAGAVSLRCDRDWLWAAAIVGAIADSLQVALSADAIGELAERRPPADPVERRADAVAWWDGLGEADRAMASGAIEPFIRYQETGDLPPITWSQGLFFHGEPPGERIRGPVDITGRAHCLVRGPDIVLPPGSWSLSLAVTLSRAAAEHEFFVEIAADFPLGSGVIRPQLQASAALTIDFVLGEETERPFQLRISTLRAAFDGAITIEAVTLRRQALPAA